MRKERKIFVLVFSQGSRTSSGVVYINLRPRHQLLGVVRITHCSCTFALDRTSGVPPSIWRIMVALWLRTLSPTELDFRRASYIWSSAGRVKAHFSALIPTSTSTFRLLRYLFFLAVFFASAVGLPNPLIKSQKPEYDIYSNGFAINLSPVLCGTFKVKRLV